MKECIPYQIANTADRIDAKDFGVADIVRTRRQEDLPFRQLFGPQRTMAQKKRLDVCERAIKNKV